MHKSCLAGDTTEPSELEFSSDSFRPVDLHGRRYLLRATGNNTLEVVSSPKIARTDQGPGLHLSVVLLQAPLPDDIYLSAHVAGGRLSLSVHATIDSVELNALSQLTGRPVIALSPERTQFKLRVADTTLALIEHSITRRATLDAGLSADQARAIMAALSQGRDDLQPLSVDCRFHWRAIHRAQWQLVGDWAAVFTIAQRVAATREGLLGSSDIDTIAAMALSSGDIRCTDENAHASTNAVIAAQLLRQLSVLFLHRDPDGYRVRDKPPAMPLSIRHTLSTTQEQSVLTTLDLLPSIKAAMAASQADNHLSITVLGNRDMHSVALPSRRSSRKDTLKSNKPAISLAGGHDFMDAQLISRPQPWLKPGLLHPSIGTLWPSIAKPSSLPIISPKQAIEQMLLPDRLQSKWRWYVPQWRFVMQQQDIVDGPFSYEFEQRGTTASGEPALFAQIAFQFSAEEPAHLQADIRAARRRGLNVNPIVPSVKTVHLQIPYVDESTGRTVLRRLRATFTQSKQRVTCHVQVQHDTVRLAYAALSHPSLQSEAAHVAIECRFSAYEALSAKGTLIKHVAPRGIMQAGITGSPVLHHVELARRPSNPILDVVKQPSLVLKPNPIKLEPVKSKPVKPMRQYKLTEAHNEQRFNVQVPCENYTQAYRERDGDTSFAIGCRRPLLLGTASRDLVQELTDLRTDAFRVFRQLHQPNRFLLLPLHYQLTRRLDETGRAVPALGLYSVLDPAREDATLFSFDAHLEPAVTPAELQRLTMSLRSYSPEPQLDMPTEVDLSAHELLLLAEGEHSYVADGPFLNVNIRTTLSEALLIKDRLESSGILGSATFTLSDGTHLQSASIKLALSDIGGPWPTGPISAEIQGRQLLLSNRSESDHEIVNAELFNPNQLLDINTVLSAGATLPWVLDADHTDAIVVSAPLQGAAPRLEEMRIFAELIRKQVAFLAPFDLIAAGTPSIEIRAQLVGIGEQYSLLLTAEERHAEIEFELPLTAILSGGALSYTVIYRNAQGAEHSTLNAVVDLSNTSVVSISSANAATGNATRSHQHRRER